MAQIVTITHAFLGQQQLDMIIDIYGERLNNELTREATLKALTLMARHDPSPITIQGLGKITNNLIQMLHKANRQIHLSTLETFLALEIRYPQQFTA